MQCQKIQFFFQNNIILVKFIRLRYFDIYIYQNRYSEMKDHVKIAGSSCDFIKVKITSSIYDFNFNLDRIILKPGHVKIASSSCDFIKVEITSSIYDFNKRGTGKEEHQDKNKF